MSRVVVVCGIHEESIGSGGLEHSTGRGGVETGHRGTTILEDQSAQLPRVRGKHALWGGGGRGEGEGEGGRGDKDFPCHMKIIKMYL